MGWLSKILGGSSNPIKDTFAGIDSLVTSDDERAAAALLRLKAEQEPAKWQHALNLANAGSKSFFIAGWRPALGWVCVTGLSITFVLNPLLSTYLGMPVQGIPTENIMELTVALLGLGALRTYEKKEGISR